MAVSPWEIFTGFTNFAALSGFYFYPNTLQCRRIHQRGIAVTLSLEFIFAKQLNLYHSLSLWFYRPPPSPPHLILFLSFLPPLVALSPLKPSPHPILLLLPPTLSPPSPLTQLLLHLAKVKLLLLLLVPHQTRGFCHLVTLFPPSTLLSLLFGLF